ncbi:methyl-accepting chemotaxis protein [Oceanospirillum sp.]|uniref:methyl-accepting chemotaxis protein n=1 Tax=Oceanospirillum sp. TaxID=2021254 RepID=UPI003A93D0C7
MFSRLRIRTRLVLGFGLFMLLVCGIVIPLLLTDMKLIIEEAERRELVSLFGQLEDRVKGEERLALALATYTANQKEIKEHLIKGDRSALELSTLPAFKQLETNFGLRQFQFHQPPATSYFRVHKTAKFGDDLSGFRETVVMTNRDVNPVSGIEKGVAGLGIRGVAPVLIEGRHWGSVEFGFSLGQFFFDQAKSETGADFVVSRPVEGYLEDYASTLGGNSLLSAELLQQVLSGEREKVFRQLDINGRDLAVYAGVLTDFSGQPAAVVQVAMKRDHYLEMLDRSFLDSVLIAAAFIIFGLILAVIITRSITRPLDSMRLAVENISNGDGDLTQKIRVDGDNEIAEIAQTVNGFIDNIESIIKKLMKSVASVSGSGSELFDITEHSIELTHKQRANTHEVATAVNEMTATAQEVAQHASSTSSFTEEASKRSSVSHATVKESIRTIHEMAENVGSTVDMINRVNEQTTEIHTILDVIHGIAEQTNLLALNAAIEAARAGEQGRGFAVVADEVRQLAQRTQEATGQINVMIADLLKVTKDTTDVINHSQEHVQELVEVANASGDALQAITDGMQQINDTVYQIASAAEEQSQVSDDINLRVVDIAEGAQESADGADKILRRTSAMGTELTSLMGVIRHFKVSNDPAIELAVARSAHQAWKMRLRTFLDGTGSISMQQAVSAHDCDFGQWYYGEGHEFCRHETDLKAIENPHIEMHELIQQIVKAKESGDQAKAEALYHKVCDLSEMIVAGMDTVIDRYKHQS